MKKTLRIGSFILVLALMVFLIYINNNSSSDVDASSKDGMVHVSLVNVNEDAGLATISYKDGDTYIDTGKTELDVASGTKIKFYYKDGLNSGYSVYFWALCDSEGYLSTVKDESNNNEYSTSEKYIKTVTSDFTIYVASKCATDSVVSFYDSSVTGKQTLTGIAIVGAGQKVSYKAVNIIGQKGFDFVKWSQDLSNVTSDTSVYPIYHATVWTIFRDYAGMFFKGLGVTLLLSVIAVFLALFLGMIICFIRLSDIHILKFIATAYVEIIRGVPLLLQLLVIYVILGPTKISFGGFFTTEVISCLLALFINSSAYVSEIFRSGIQAVDAGQMEAGRALGMSKWKVMLKVVMPQGIRNSLPSIGNELIAMIKETSLAVSVDASIGELMSVRKQITAATYINLPPYIVVAIIYFIVTFSLSKLIGVLEKRLAHEK